MPTGRVISVRACIKEKETFQIDNPSSHLRKLGDEGQQNKRKAGRRKGLLKVSAVIGEWKTRKTEGKISEMKIWFSEMSYNTYEPLARRTQYTYSGSLPSHVFTE